MLISFTYISDSASRNTLGIEKAYFELSCTLFSEIATYEVTLKAMCSMVVGYQKYFRMPTIFGILFGKYWVKKIHFGLSMHWVSDSQIWSEVHLRYYFCPIFVKKCSKTSQNCMASLLAICDWIWQKGALHTIIEFLTLTVHNFETIAAMDMNISA